MANLPLYFLQNMLDQTRIFKVQTDFQEKLCTIAVGFDESNRRFPTPLKGWSELDHLIHKKNISSVIFLEHLFINRCITDDYHLQKLK